MKGLRCSRCGKLCGISDCEVCGLCGNVYCLDCANSSLELCDKCSENLEYYN